jgi:hypothetical protein
LKPYPPLLQRVETDHHLSLLRIEKAGLVDAPTKALSRSAETQGIGNEKARDAGFGHTYFENDKNIQVLEHFRQANLSVH